MSGNSGDTGDEGGVIARLRSVLKAIKNLVLGNAKRGADTAAGGARAGKNRLKAIAARLGEGAKEAAEETAERVSRQATSTGGSIKVMLDQAAKGANNTIQAVSDAVVWMIEHVEHMSIQDREQETNYHRIRAVGDASAFLHKHMADIGLEEYDIHIEASIDSHEGSEDMLTVEIYKTDDQDTKPVEEPAVREQEMAVEAKGDGQ